MKITLSDHFTFGRLFRFILPSVVMMIFTSIYGVVDGFFVSNFAGKTSFAAINLIMPAVMIFGAVGFMLGTGGSALVAKTLGEGDKDRANRYFSMIIKVVITVGIVLSVVGIVFMRNIAELLGATDILIDDCVLYGRIILVAITPFMLQNCFQSFFSAAEKPKIGLAITVCAGVTNMILDFLLVGVFGFGVAGAAVATAISECVGGFIPFFYFARKNKSPLKLSWAKIEWKALLRCCTNGSSEMLTNLSMSLVNMLYNMQLLKYAAEDGVAAYGIIMYVNFIFVSAFIGYSIGTAPIIGYNYGAGNSLELKNILRKSITVLSIASICICTAAELSAGLLAKIFVGFDPELTAMTCRGFRIFSLSFLFNGTNIFSSAFFTALNNGIVSAIISFCRTFVLQIAAIFILPIFLGLDGIWSALPVAEFLTLFVSVSFLLANRKKYNYGKNTD